MSAADNHFFVPADYFRRLRAEEIFPDAAGRPLEVDLGSGDGTFLLEMAAHYPGRNFLGVERLLGRARKTCRKAARRGLANVKVLRLESAYTVEWLLPEASVSRVHLLFPDPWPKKRHHRRRLVNREFLESLARILVSEGGFCFKTDHAKYSEAVLEEMRGAGAFREEPWPSGDNAYYPETDFERQWKEEGRKVHVGFFRKIGGA